MTQRRFTMAVALRFAWLAEPQLVIKLANCLTFSSNTEILATSFISLTERSAFAGLFLF